MIKRKEGRREARKTLYIDLVDSEALLQIRDEIVLGDWIEEHHVAHAHNVLQLANGNLLSDTLSGEKRHPPGV